MAKQNHVWIVEMLMRNGWEPTVGCKLTRKEGLKELSDWRRRCRDDQFRLRQYAQGKGEKA